MLATLGPVKTKELLTGHYTAWKDATDKFEDELPAQIKLAKTAQFYSNDILQTKYGDVQREWKLADLASLRKTCLNLHKIKLIHGDLTDTSDRAPYDLIYLSNALEHTDRNGKNPRIEVLSTLMKKTSKVIWVQAQGTTMGSNPQAKATWRLRTMIKSDKAWEYHLSTLKEPVQPALSFA